MKRIIGTLIAIATTITAHAGNLIELTVFPSASVPSDGQAHFRSFQNTTGAPMYIKRLRAYLFPGGMTGGFAGVVLRQSDASGLTYWAWGVDCDTMGRGPHGNVIAEDYSPESIELDSGDSLTLRSQSSPQFRGPSSISVWIWYTTQP